MCVLIQIYVSEKYIHLVKKYFSIQDKERRVNKGSNGFDMEKDIEMGKCKQLKIFMRTLPSENRNQEDFFRK